jgi:hypothetical protein
MYSTQQPKEVHAFRMKWTPPQYSREEVNKAGKWLTAKDDVVSLVERDHMLEVINNWRAAHGFPLQCMKMSLLNRAKKIDAKAIVAQRLKRLSSITAKLEQHSDWMKLTQMQDIGGCRAIVENIRRLKRLIKAYKKGTAKNPTKRHVLSKPNDYISEPKPDGYRSYHLVYRYQSVAEKHKVFNDLKIEIQLRSRLQHAWATAVETVATFSGYPLKSGGGPADWRRFFALTASAIAVREKCPPVPGTPTDKTELIDELRLLVKQLGVKTVLIAWRTSMKIVTTKVPNAAVFLLEIDPSKWVVNYTGFTKDRLKQASEAYLAREKAIAANPVPGAQVVLVSTTSVKALRTAFPNYHLDTTVFLEALDYAIK